MSSRIKKSMDWVDEKSDLIQALCSILSVLIVGVIGLVLSSKANEIGEEQFFFSSQPYFTISDISTGGLPTYQICNEGGYIQNATLELGNILKIDIFVSGNFVKTIFVPFGNNKKELYDLKNKSFTISSPRYVMEASEMENRLVSFYRDTDYNFHVYSFQYIEIDYVDCNHVFQDDTYLIGSEYGDGENEYFLTICRNELKQSILENMPDEFKSESNILFPQGTLDRINPPGGAGRTFTDDAEQEFDDVVEQIKKIIG